MKKAFYLAVLLFGACSSSDIVIDSDYSIYDLGGSNQVLMNKSGTVRVPDITAFYVTRNNIAFETNGGGDSQLQNRGMINKVCEYGVVNKASGRFLVFPVRSVSERLAMSLLRKSGKILLSRSCLAG